MKAFEIIPSKPEHITVYVGFSKLDLTELKRLNPPREDGYPKVREIKAKEKFKSDRKDPNYELPISALEKEY